MASQKPKKKALLQSPGKTPQEWKAWSDAVQKERDDLKKAIKDIVAYAKKRIDDTIDFPKAIGAMLDAFDDYGNKSSDLFEGHIHLNDQAVGWSVEAYLEKRLLLPLIEEVYQELVKRGYSENNSLSYNDLDNCAYYLEHPTKHIFVIEAQTPRYLFIYEPGRDLHIRQIWDTYQAPDDKWAKDEVKEYEKKGIRHAILHAEDLASRYSDNLNKNPYVSRPDLQFYKDTKFQPRYGDCRDPGYAISYQCPISDKAEGRVDRGLHTFSVLKSAIFYFLTTLAELRESTQEN